MKNVLNLFLFAEVISPKAKKFAKFVSFFVLVWTNLKVFKCNTCEKQFDNIK